MFRDRKKDRKCHILDFLPNTHCRETQFKCVETSLTSVPSYKHTFPLQTCWRHGTRGNPDRSCHIRTQQAAGECTSAQEQQCWASEAGASQSRTQPARARNRAQPRPGRTRVLCGRTESTRCLQGPRGTQARIHARTPPRATHRPVNLGPPFWGLMTHLPLHKGVNTTGH